MKKTLSATLADVVEKRYDYVICGGGTAGLTLAARLTEDPHVSVLVLEAGNDNLDDPAILVPAQFGRHLGDDKYDWNFKTKEQIHCDNRQYAWSRGKGLGGSSGINFYAYTRPPIEDINAWEELGNPGWNWDRFLKYSKRGEKFTPPTPEQTSAFRHTYDPQYHGTEGELDVSFPSLIMAGEVPFQDTLNNAGIKTVKDPLGGDVNGTWMSAVTLDPKTHTRSYAATAFYKPNAGRQNLTVLTGALVTKLIFSDVGAETSQVDVMCQSVQFSHSGGSHSVRVGKEAILCAGALKSPQILELSGIGSPRVLGPLGLQCLVSLEGVGESAQDHAFFGVSYELDEKHGYETLDRLRNQEYAAEQLKLHASQQGIYRLGLAGFTFCPLAQLSPHADVLISAQSAKLKRAFSEGRISKALWEQYQIQLKVLKSATSVDCEIIAFPQFFTFANQPEIGKAYMTILSALNHPFSRGSVHIGSTDSSANPIMDPRYFEDDFDLQLMVETAKFVRTLKDVEPFKSMIVREVDPGPETTTDDALREYIMEFLMTTYHTAGTCSMLPREKGGVVDHRLKVYGTSNVRVVDLSIVPLHVATHTQATVYSIAEQAADIIKGIL